MNKKKSSAKFPLILLATVGLLFIGSCLLVRYLQDYSKATQKAYDAMYGVGNLLVEETEEYLYFSNGEEKEEKVGIIFYPGGKVEEDAYAPLLSELAELGFEVYLVSMPWKLAIFDADAADAVLESDKDIDHWIMMGHSLGGAMAADYTARHSDKVDGLVLLAAYSLKDISKEDIPVLSIYGSEDGVLNKNKYEDCFSNLPEDAYEYVIDGGNHANFGYYGEQKGDKEAEISREEQIQQVMDQMILWLKD